MITGFVTVFSGALALGALAVVGWFAWDAFRKLSGSAVILFAGLFVCFVGERVYGYAEQRMMLTGLGAAILVSATALRAWAMQQSSGNRQGAHRTALVYTAVVVGALGLYAATQETAVTALGLEGEVLKRWMGVFGSVWPIGIAVGLAPVVLIDRLLALHPVLLPIGATRRAALSGVSAALALALAFPVNYLAAHHQTEWDTAYFRTTRPGSSTLALVGTLTAPVEVFLFQPAGSDVGREMQPYFEQLAASSGGQISWSMVDQAIDPKIAEALKVRENGFIALRQGEKVERVKIGTELEKAKRELKKLDGTVQKTLMKLTRGQQTIYLLTGHGELNTREKDDPLRKLTTFKKLLETQNYTIKNLGATEGSANAVPDDAAAVVVAGPETALLPEEVATLEAYWAKGGHLLLLVEPGADPADNLDPLLSTLGLRAGRAPLANASKYVSFTGQSRGVADRVNLVTNRFGSHDSMKTLSRNSTQVFLALPTAVALDKVPETKNKLTTLVRSMPDTWEDADGDREKTAGEAEKVFELAFAVTPPDAASEARAIVVGDATLLSDPLLQSKGNVVFGYDAMRWLVGDEEIAGEVESEEDVKIVHTREEDQNWFYATTVLVPTLVLLTGVVFVRTRGRKQS
jgi:hypothetical protein